MAAPVVQKDTLTQHQLVLHEFMKFASPVDGVFNGNEINAGDFNNSRVIAVPDIKVDDYIVDADIARIGNNHYEGSEFTGEWKNGIPPIEWRQYSMSRRRSFGYTVFEEQEKYVPIKNLPQEYLARKMSTTVIRDHDKYLLLAIVLGRMTGKLIARTQADDYISVTEDTTGVSPARIACTGNQADYKWIAQPGEQSDNEIQPTFATIKGMTFDKDDPLKTLDALTTMFSENWFDTNFSNSERFVMITASLEIAFRDQLIKAGTYVDAGYNTYKDADTSGVTGPAFFGSLRGWNFIKIHPEFMPTVFVASDGTIDPSPTLTGIGTASGRTLKKVAALAAYKGSAQTHNFFDDQRSEDGGTRGKFTDYVQDFAYDAWVIDQKSEGIVPLFLPDDTDAGLTDYTAVDDSFNRIAAAVNAARANGSTISHPGAPVGFGYYPITGPDVNPSRPEWYNQPYGRTNNIDNTLSTVETGDLSHNHHSGEINPIDAEELAAAISIIVDSQPAWTDEETVTEGATYRFSDGGVYKVTNAGTTGATEPTTTGVDVGDTVEDGDVIWTRVL